MQETAANATYRADDLARFTGAMFIAAGLAPERAHSVAELFLEADLLGYTTHGLNRVPANLAWLQAGETRRDGDPDVLIDAPAHFHWDAHRLPGPFVVRRAVREAVARAQRHGIVTGLIRDCQHIACLAAYLVEPVLAGYVVQIVASSPDDRCVAPFGGRDAVFAPNPFAFAAPTDSDPILIDMSFSVVAEGHVARARELGQRMTNQCLLTAAGEPTNDPNDYWTEPKGSILPIGGLDHGYKGSALLLWSELMTLALGNHGRRDSQSYSEANTVLIQVIDPDAFGTRHGFAQEASHIAKLCRQSRSLPGGPPVRVPGDRAWAARRKQLAEGVVLHPLIMPKLVAWAERLDVAVPDRLRSLPDPDR